MRSFSFRAAVVATLAFATMSLVSTPSFAQEKIASASTKPTHGQKAMIARGYGMFIHFGINTFNQTEWSDGTLPISSYNPTHLDCDQWIRTAKEAGFRHIVLTTKHHDGFCLWPTQYTNYSVAHSPVKTDVVGEVAKACRKYGVKLGLYYSLWDRHEPTYKNDFPAYFTYMKNQLRELLTQYGNVCELWFDGGWDKPNDDWRVPELYAFIKGLQPNCEVTINNTIHVPGESRRVRLPTDYVQGDPIRYWPVDFRTQDPSIARFDDPTLYTAPNGQLHYLPFEHTICLSDYANWFQKAQVTPTRSLDELEELFYWGTQNDHVLLLNMPPDQTGRLRENERETILALAARLGIEGGHKLLPSPPVNQAWNVPATATSVWTQDAGYGPEKAVDTSLETRWAAQDNVADLTLTPAKPFVFDRLAIHEYADVKDMGDGFSQERQFRIEKYTLDVLQNGEWKTIYVGTTIGAAKVWDLAEKITADALRLHITQASAPPSIWHIAVSDRATAKENNRLDSVRY